jgi:hypothetical protein
MKIENRIFATLQKTKEKQNLGAIEDAVNEAKSILKDSNDQMVAVTRSLETGLAKAQQAMSELISNLSDVMRQADDEFYTLQMEAFKQQAELDNLGISYDTDIDVTVEFFQQMYDKADGMI